MRVIVDTSALFALVCSDDSWHQAAVAAVHDLLLGDCSFYVASYTAVEAAALTQARLGLEAVGYVRRFVDEDTAIVWIDAELHAAAWDELERIGRRQVSLVDCALAVAALREGITDVFAYDSHFAEWGLNVIS